MDFSLSTHYAINPLAERKVDEINDTTHTLIGSRFHNTHSNI